MVGDYRCKVNGRRFGAAIQAMGYDSMTFNPGDGQETTRGLAATPGLLTARSHVAPRRRASSPTYSSIESRRARAQRHGHGG